MRSYNAARRRLVRSAVVGAALAAVTSLTPVAATSASAAVSPTKLCADHGGVDIVGKGWVSCMDGEAFHLS
ncbi:MAG TPA: hypothetical protein VFQ85_10080 [Mycobacteriales bacterium]|jgi:hypothetical protein|nr:hypothetical protein [Mycobacteriales bacterium]